MEPPGGRDSRFNLGYSMNLLSGETPPEIYGGGLGRPSTSLQQLSPRHTMVSSACGTRTLKSDVCYDDRGGISSQQGMGFEAGGVNNINDEPYNSLQSKKSPPSNGKKTKGRVKIKMEYIENKLRRYTTFSKRKTGIMKKAYELSTLTGTQVMLLVASETGHVYTFATRKLQPMITSEAGKALIQTCLNSPDPPVGASGGDQRMSATGFEETELTYNVSDEDSKENNCESSGADEDDDFMSDEDDIEPPEKVFIQSDLSQVADNYSTSSQNLEKTPESSSHENTRPTTKHDEQQKTAKDIRIDKNDSTIINQINKINNALILSNKAKAASAAQCDTPTSLPNIIQPSPVPTSVPPSSSPQVLHSPASQSILSSLTSTMQSQIAVQLPGNIKAVPLLVQTANGGVGFAGLSEGMILGMIQGQGSTEPKLVAMPLSSIAQGGIGCTMAMPLQSSTNNDVR